MTKLYVKDNPLLVASWSPKNPSIPSKLSEGSHKEFWWVGKCGHEWEYSVRGKVKRPDCPYCTGRKVLPGYNDLESSRPEIAQEWSSKNQKTPQEYSLFSNEKVSWECNEGHEWQAVIADRVRRNSGCPYCNSLLVLPGYNDLATTHPEIAQQMDNDKNDKRAFQVTYKTSDSLFWLCEKGHSWKQTVRRRVQENRNCPYCLGQKSIPGENTLDIKNPKLAMELLPEKSGFTASEVMPGSMKRGYWRCEEKHVWEATVNDRNTGYGCPECAKKRSKQEIEVAAYVSSILPGEEILFNRRFDKIELDIYIPSKNLAIEYNGIYWHSEVYKSQKYHKTKREYCESKGIQLVQIWEDDWTHKKEIVKSMISHKLGVNRASKIYARKTSVVALSYIESAKFLDANHIQGAAKGTFYYGLSFEGTLYACLVLKRQGEDYLLSRYATSCIIPGGFQKLVAHIERTLNYKSLITFADLEISQGNLYANNGWVRDGELEEDYSYIVNERRTHKFNYRKTRFKNDPNLIYEEGLTEHELAKLNGIKRAWDSGKIRFIKENK